MKALLLAASGLILSGCASTQLNSNTVEISSTVDDVYTREALNNISKFIDNRFAIPSQTILSAGTIQTVNTVSPTVTFPFTDQLARTLTASGSPSVANARTTAGAGASLAGTNTQQQNYTVAPVNDAITLRNQQVLYQHAVYNAEVVGQYIPLKIFIKDEFYLDPFQLQRPHCVVCAKKQGVFDKQKGIYDQRSSDLEVNPKLKGAWVYFDDGRNALGERTDEILKKLGHFGQHDLFMKKKDLDSGVLNDFVLFTLSYGQPTETFSSSGPQFVINNMPATAGSGVVNGPNKAETKNNKPRYIPQFPNVPSSGFPASNLRIAPPSQFNLIIPQTILPTQ